MFCPGMTSSGAAAGRSVTPGNRLTKKKDGGRKGGEGREEQNAEGKFHFKLEERTLRRGQKDCRTAAARARSPGLAAAERGAAADSRLNEEHCDKVNRNEPSGADSGGDVTRPGERETRRLFRERTFSGRGGPTFALSQRGRTAQCCICLTYLAVARAAGDDSVEEITAG